MTDRHDGRNRTPENDLWPEHAPGNLRLRLLDALSYPSVGLDDIWHEMREWLVANEVPVTDSVLGQRMPAPHGRPGPVWRSFRDVPGRKGTDVRLTRHIYASSHRGITTDALDDLLQKSRANNVRDGITGALVIGEDRFLQLLEGDRAAVGRCFMRIMQDSRHSNIQVLSCGDAEHRLFLEWSMHRIETSQVKQEILSRYKVANSFDPLRMTQFAIEDMCRTLSHGNWQIAA